MSQESVMTVGELRKLARTLAGVAATTEVSLVNDYERKPGARVTVATVGERTFECFTPYGGVALATEVLG